MAGIATVIFGLTDINRIHLIWVVPVGFFLSWTTVGRAIGQTVGYITASVFGKAGVNKNELIKQLVKLRVKSDPMVNATGFNENMVDALSEFQLAGLPESTIIAIVETWAILKKKGIPEEEIFMKIENHRASFGDFGELPTPLTLSNYIKYRLDLEHGHGAPIKKEFLDNAIEVAINSF
jgi:hypothetical protein